MGYIKEPKNVDFTVQSEPWTDEELKDFRKIIAKLKTKKPMNRKNIQKPISEKKS